jgi:hypothetical protein
LAIESFVADWAPKSVGVGDAALANAGHVLLQAPPGNEPRPRFCMEAAPGKLRLLSRRALRCPWVHRLSGAASCRHGLDETRMPTSCLDEVASAPVSDTGIQRVVRSIRLTPAGRRWPPPRADSRSRACR